MSRSLVGIFVGGKSSRMGGAPKGLLRTASGESVAERLVRICGEGLGGVPIVLVGDARAYARLNLPWLADTPTGIGPIGGLAALLSSARKLEVKSLIALACDFPGLTAELVRRLAGHAPEAPAVAARPHGVWQPLCARYDPPFALLATERLIRNDERALYRVLEELGAAELPLEPGDFAALVDWDEPADVKP
ncbi:MAG: molybdenum cofactor guanylyltransferase [Steroidobacteraceae bacterium]